MNIFSAMFTGLAVWSSPSSGPPTADTQSTQVAMVEVVPNFQVTALSQADLDMYLDVMRGAAGHIAQVSSPNRGAETASPPGTYDEAVADKQGVRARYDAVKAVVEAPAGSDAASDALVRTADEAVLAPHASEIQALQKQVNGFIYER
jgi:hypothetical protein